MSQLQEIRSDGSKSNLTIYIDFGFPYEVGAGKGPVVCNKREVWAARRRAIVLLGYHLINIFLLYESFHFRAPDIKLTLYCLSHSVIVEHR